MKTKNYYLVGDIEFRTKDELKSYVQSILHSYEFGDYLNGEHFRFMLELLNGHPEAKAKIKDGVQAIKIIKLEWGNKSFGLERFDGSTTDFSFVSCIHPVSQEQKFRRACRALVAPDVKKFKADAFADAEGHDMECPVTGEMVSIDTSHVDHEAPMTFDKIITDFVDEKGINFDTVDFSESTDNSTGRKILDENITRGFLEFHEKNAKLRIISSQANLRMRKRP